ncbi:MAG: glycosyltransferase [Rhodocyclaceae bacterium]|nr:glycosyltransferase [Rhodocyclaceae bacterium]
MEFSDTGPALLCIGLVMAVFPFMRRDSNLFRLLASAICAAAVVRYLFWRILNTLPPLAFEASSLWAWGFVVLEVGASLSGLTVLLYLSRQSNRSAAADRNMQWVDETLPRVALLIPTYNEEHEILERTILGARAQDYRNLGIHVLDDSRRDWLREMCAAHGVSYHRRANNRHAKAGNMNEGLAAIIASGEQPEFVAILDADFVAMPQFVRRALALMRDPSVGVVQTPQHFFNDDPFQHAFHAGDIYPDEQRFFFDTILPAKDAWGVAFSCGTSSIVRRTALERIGGFPTESVTEDMLLSLKMQEHGYTTAYLAERLTQGLAPEGVGEYITQRARWCLGLMQILRSKWGPFGRNGFNLITRLSIIDSALYWTLTFPFRIMCLLVPIAFWLTGTSVVHTTLGELVSYLGPAVILQVGYLAWLSRGRILPIMTDANQLVVAPAAIGAALTGLFRPLGHKFSVTAKGGDRSRIVVQWGLLARIGALMGLTVAGVIYAHLDHTMPYHDSDAFVVSLFWSYYNIFVLLIAAFVCIEMPREREEHFLTSETARIRLGGRQVMAQLRSLAQSEACFTGPAPAARGESIIIELSGSAPLAAQIEPAGNNAWIARLDPSDATRRIMFERLFSGAYRRPPPEFRFHAILGAMIRSLAGNTSRTTLIAANPCVTQQP